MPIAIDVPVFVIRKDPILGKQDEVDNLIYYVMCQVAGKEIEWDIEGIANVRDVVLDELYHMGFDKNEMYPSCEEN